jgi:Family of unknown function (DUF5681)
VKENMSDGNETEDYEVGYRKPPKNGQFKKGVSGNPSGRPKKPSDFASELKQELNAKLVINENGKRRVITKGVGLKRQVVNKAVSGDLRAARLVADWTRKDEERAAEQQQSSSNKPDHENLKREDLTDEDLLLIAQGIHPKYSGNRKPDNQSSSPKID